MRRGYIVSIIGGLAAVIGTAFLAMFYLETVEEDIIGMSLPLGQAALAMGALAIAYSVFALVYRGRRRMGMANVLVGFLGLTNLAYLSFFSLNAFPPDTLVEGEFIQLVEGMLVDYIGFGFVILGGIMSWTASRGWGGDEEEYLRVAILWHGTIIQERIFVEPSAITIGEDLSSTFVVPPSDLPKKTRLFVSDRRGNYKVGLLADMDGKVRIGGKTANIGDYVKKHTGGASGSNFVSIKGKDWGIINIGEIALFFQFVTQEEKIPKKSLWAFDKNVVGTTLLSAIVQLAFIFWTLFTWEETAIKKKRNNIKKLMKVEVQVEDEIIEELPDLGEEEDTTAKKAEGEEGKFGDPDLDPEVESKVPKRDGKMVKEIDPKKVGLVDMLSSNTGAGAISQILSNDTGGFSNKLAVAMSGAGAEFVMGHGSGGLGFKGTGTGGGGTGGYGRIHGLGKIDTGGGTGVKANLGKKKAKKVGSVALSSGSAEGFCEKKNIRKVVKMRTASIKACYEAQLQIKPELKGKLTVRWTINQKGKVEGAAVISTTLNNKTVENCVLRSIRRMKFNKPEGGICIVKWPFVFNPG